MLQLDRTIESLIALIDMIYKQRYVCWRNYIYHFMGKLDDMIDDDLDFCLCGTGCYIIATTFFCINSKINLIYTRALQMEHYNVYYDPFEPT